MTPEPTSLKRARALLGTRFRAQGRDIGTGIDCAGVAILAFGLPVERFRHDYRLRGNHRGEIAAALGFGFRRVSRRCCRPGDLMLIGVARDQLHLAICSPVGFIHADARIGRVIETPGAPSWPLLAVYRRRVRAQRGI